MVDGILDCKRDNGFGNRRKDVAASLCYTSGAMLRAAEHALKHGVACAPVSGFHHAGYDSPSGFCTFNGLVVTAMHLLTQERVKKVAIVDFDAHYGNGTDELIEHHALETHVLHWTFGGVCRSRSTAKQYVEGVGDVVKRFVAEGADIVLYQAGADPHVDDPLGGYLTDAELAERDRRVFQAARETRIPIAWNLAGGYQKIERNGEPIAPVLDIHEATMRECAAAYGLL